MPAQKNGTQELRDLYRELILDHARSPRHFGKLDEMTHSANGINPLCGDKLHLYCSIGANGIIEAAAFEGSGCAISVASASLLTDAVHGMPQQDALTFCKSVIDSLTGNSDVHGEDLGKMEALQGVKEFPSRVKCATLAWHALRSAINQNNDPVSTE
jgi:nitrogen fixation NifU-like protein